jgi:hypothetical protein
MTTYASFPAGLGGAEEETGAKLNVMLLYDSINSANRAAQLIASLALREPNGLAINLSPMSFSTLSDATLNALATTDARNAHLIVITVSGRACHLPVPVERWLKIILTVGHEANLAVLALFVREERAERADSPRLRTVKSLVEEAGGSFFAPITVREVSLEAGLAASPGAVPTTAK